MTLEELRIAIKDKTFTSTAGGFRYEFVPENTLRIFGDSVRSTHYTIDEKDGKFILNHESFFGSEPLTIEVIPNESGRLELTLDTQFSKKFIGTWTEEQEFL